MPFYILKVVIEMFWLGLVVGLVLGANISLFLYAIILSGKKADENIEKYS